MITKQEISTLPKTLEEFMVWEPEDGFKYEWNDGELIKFTGMNKNQLYIYAILSNLFFKKGYGEIGTLVAEQDVMLSGIQMRRPDISYFSREQINNTKLGIDEIPEFVIEVISGSDNSYKIEDKIAEYFKAGVKVIWNVYPEHKLVYVYTSRKDVKICTDSDICSAKPVLPEFEINVDAIFA
ncbi:MAG: Uma2 family endonuclease [Spirosomaceae bacterium]|jgi:Uma2 family endonuclease|nr:Uma2 family endonuclease [Spirosomataceae bacterium]